MHDKHGKPLHKGDKVRNVKTGDEFHIQGYSLEDHTGAKAVAFAADVELLSKDDKNKDAEAISGDCIVWGNGK